MDGETLRQIRVPGPGPARARIVGPGRLERAYRTRIECLEAALEDGDRRATGLSRELETSQRVERGCQKRIDRLEERQAEERAERLALEQRERRLILLLGAVQRENELLRESLALAAPQPQALPPRAGARARRRRGWWARRLGSGPRGA